MTGRAISPSEAVFNAVAGTNYLIAVDGRASVSGDIVLSWNLNANITQIPMIVQQPLDTTVVTGDTADFDMFAASTAILSYQWYLGDWLAIPSANTNTFSITNVSYLNVGTYSVEVTAATGQNVESLPASLEIGPSLSYDKFSDLMDAATGGGGPNLRIKPLERFIRLPLGVGGHDRLADHQQLQLDDRAGRADPRRCRWRLLPLVSADGDNQRDDGD